MTTCIAEFDLCISRDETLDLNFKLTGGIFEDVALNPDNYKATLTIRDSHESWARDFATIVGTFSDVTDACGTVCATAVMLNFYLSAAQLWTAMPQSQKTVYIVELEAVPDPDPVTRLFQGDFKVNN